jgi:hypothetical protein
MMIKRPRCRSCQRRIWPWQPSMGRAVVGAKDNDPRRSWMRHMGCIQRDRVRRRLSTPLTEWPIDHD